MKPDILIVMMEEQTEPAKPDYPVIAGCMAKMTDVPDCFSVSPLQDMAFQCFLTGRYPKALEDPLKSDRTWVMDFAEGGYQTVFLDLNSNYSDGHNMNSNRKECCPQLCIIRCRKWDRNADELLGQWLQDEHGQRWENQMILILSGNLKSDFGQKDIAFHDEAIRMLLWIKPAAAWQAGVKYLKGAVETVDIGATLASAAGIRLSYRQNGVSFLPGLEGGAVGREWIISEWNGYTMIRTVQWKAVYDPDGRICRLFDREHDHEERINLAGQTGTWQLEQSMSLLLANLDDE